MSQLSKGTTYTDVSPGNVVTATNLNAHVDAAVLAAGAIHEQTPETVTDALDEVLVWDASAAALRRVVLPNLNPAAAVTPTQLTQAAAGDVNQYADGTLTGGTHYLVTLAPVRTGAYVAGEQVAFKASAANTGAINIKLNARAEVGLLDQAGAELAANVIASGQIVVAICDGTDFRMVSQQSIGVQSGVVANSRNLVIATASVATATIAADEVLLKTAAGIPYLASAVSVTVDIGLGVALNGLDAGTESADAWYYVYLISNGTLVRSVLSTSATAPTLSAGAFAGYTYYALVGVLRNTSSNFIASYQTDRWIAIAKTDVFTNAVGHTGYTASDMSALANIVPPMARSCSGSFGSSTNNNHGMAIAGNAAGVGAQCIVGSATGVECDLLNIGAPFHNVPLITAQTLYWKSDDTDASYQITISGYRI